MDLLTKKTRYQLHLEGWSSCLRCPLCDTRRHVVLVRGSLPCDVLFVGEAPGESEDVLGKPFCGPAGKLLEDIIAQGFAGRSLSVAFTNLVACIPRDDSRKAEEPPADSIMACAPRLQEIVDIASPRLIVCVGALAEAYLMGNHPSSHKVGKSKSILRYNKAYVAITHPAAILRANVAQRGLAIQRCVIALRNAMEELE